MDKFIKEPYKDTNWDPSKGDFVNRHVIKEDKLHEKKKKKKKALIILLALSHILLLSLILLFY